MSIAVDGNLFIQGKMTGQTCNEINGQHRQEIRFVQALCTIIVESLRGDRAGLDFLKNKTMLEPMRYQLVLSGEIRGRITAKNVDLIPLRLCDLAGRVI